MLRIVCPECGPSLMWESRISGMEHTADGIIVRYRCWCGHEGRLLTGRRSRPVREGRR
jgi:hypothetical protein